MTFTAFWIAAMNHAKKELHMVLKFLQALPFPFRLPVAHADERQHRRHIHHRQCVRVRGPDLPRRNQGAEEMCIRDRMLGQTLAEQGITEPTCREK